MEDLLTKNIDFLDLRFAHQFASWLKGRAWEELASQAELLPGETSSGLVRFQRSKNTQGIYVRPPQFSLVN